MKIFAHRGDCGSAPENTMAAFRRAISVGADGVEFDVQATREGTPVVIHDETLERTGGAPGKLGERTLAELAGLDFGGWFAPEFAGERLPILAEVLELFRPTEMAINIELKTGREPYPGLVAAVAGLVADFGLGGRVIFSSFNHLTLLEAKALAPEVETAALVYEQMVEPWEYAARHGFRAVHPVRHAVTGELVRNCHDRGLAVRCWTVNEREEVLRLLGLGVDGLITDHPALARGWRDEQAGAAGEAE